MSRRARLTAEIWNSRQHSRKREIARHLAQIRSGALKGPFVSDEARYHALGLTAPSDVKLLIVEASFANDQEEG